MFSEKWEMVVGTLDLGNGSYFHKCFCDDKKILWGKDGASAILTSWLFGESWHGISRSNQPLAMEKSPSELTQQSDINDTAKTASLPKAPQFDSKALSVEGWLGSQLDTTLLHMTFVPQGYKGNHLCQLHSWANKEKTGKNEIPCKAWQNVIRCKKCTVSICLWCWELYHTECDLNSKIDSILSFQ